MNDCTCATNAFTCPTPGHVAALLTEKVQPVLEAWVREREDQRAVAQCEVCGGQSHEPCERCGAIVHVGDWPFCPHQRGTFTVVADAIPGGLVVHNLGPKPVKVYSHAERRAIMRARGLREHVEHVDGDKFVGRMV
jgi:hypothetical protein